MKTRTNHLILAALILSAVWVTQAQETSWTLERCVAYAVQNNVRVKGTQLDSLSAVSTYKQAWAAQLPSLSASAQYSASRTTGQNAAMAGGDDVSQSNRYSINAGWTVFAGTSIRTAVRQSEKNVVATGLSIQQAKFDITMAVVQAYLQVLYSRESVTNAEQTLEASSRQYERVRELAEVGSASRVDLTQIQSQHAADKYSLVVAQNNLDTDLLKLKQLLEIPSTEKFEPVFPEYGQSLALDPLPEKQAVFTAAVKTVPDMQRQSVALKVAELELKRTVAGYLPTVTVTGGLTSSHDMNGGTGGQLSDNLSPSVGLLLSVPIYDNRKSKTQVEKARIGIEQAQLSLTSTEKDLLQEVETAYLKAVSARSRLEAATERLSAARAGYDLAVEQYEQGMIQSVDLLVEKNTFLSAQTEQLQSKYTVLLYAALLDLYQGRQVELPQAI